MERNMLNGSILSWTGFIDEYFQDRQRFDVKIFEYELFNSILIKAKTSEIGLYVQFDLNKDSSRIIKLEFGTDEGFTKCKGVFNSLMQSNIDFEQYSWLSEAKACYEIPFTKENLVNVSEFLKLPIEYGWEEKQYYYKNHVYKTIVSIVINGQNLVFAKTLRSMEEQDLPLPIDNLIRLLSKIFMDFMLRIKKGTTKVMRIPSALSS